MSALSPDMCMPELPTGLAGPVDDEFRLANHPILIRSSVASNSDLRNRTARPILKSGTNPATRGLAFRGVFLERLIRHRSNLAA